jgi:hypothetical protein
MNSNSLGEEAAPTNHYEMIGITYYLIRVTNYFLYQEVHLLTLP